jgi:hypothetical protein
MTNLEKNDEVSLVQIVDEKRSMPTPKIVIYDTQVKKINRWYAYIPEKPATPYRRKNRETNNPLCGGTSFLLDRFSETEKDCIESNGQCFTSKRAYGGYYIDGFKIRSFFEKEGFL